jgi:GTP-binding protein
VDSPSKAYEVILDFYELGFGEPVPISAANMTNIGDLLDRIVEGFPDDSFGRVDESVHIAIIGKPNVGKSSLLNALIGEKIAAVSDKPQTTRTKITGVLNRDGTQYVFMDTP